MGAEAVWAAVHMHDEAQHSVRDASCDCPIARTQISGTFVISERSSLPSHTQCDRGAGFPSVSLLSLKIPRKPDTSRPGRICVIPESLENTGTPLREHNRMDRQERQQAVAELFARAVRRRAASRRQSRDSSESRVTAVDVTPEIRLTVSQPPGTTEPQA